MHAERCETGRYKSVSTAMPVAALVGHDLHFEDTVMKLPLALALVTTFLGGCAVVPVAPPAAYAGPRAVVVAPAIVVRPFFYERWRRY